MLLAEVISWLLVLKLTYLKKFYFTRGETGHAGKWEFFEGPTDPPRQCWGKPRLRGCGDFFSTEECVGQILQRSRSDGREIVTKIGWCDSEAMTCLL